MVKRRCLEWWRSWIYISLWDCMLACELTWWCCLIIITGWCCLIISMSANMPACKFTYVHVSSHTFSTAMSGICIHACKAGMCTGMCMYLRLYLYHHDACMNLDVDLHVYLHVYSLHAQYARTSTHEHARARTSTHEHARARTEDFRHTLATARAEPHAALLQILRVFWHR